MSVKSTILSLEAPGQKLCVSLVATIQDAQGKLRDLETATKAKDDSKKNCEKIMYELKVGFKQLRALGLVLTYGVRKYERWKDMFIGGRVQGLFNIAARTANALVQRHVMRQTLTELLIHKNRERGMVSILSASALSEIEKLFREQGGQLKASPGLIRERPALLLSEQDKTLLLNIWAKGVEVFYHAQKAFSVVAPRKIDFEKVREQLPKPQITTPSENHISKPSPAATPSNSNQDDSLNPSPKVSPLNSNENTLPKPSLKRTLLDLNEDDPLESSPEVTLSNQNENTLFESSNPSGNHIGVNISSHPLQYEDVDSNQQDISMTPLKSISLKKRRQEEGDSSTTPKKPRPEEGFSHTKGIESAADTTKRNTWTPKEGNSTPTTKESPHKDKETRHKEQLHTTAATITNAIPCHKCQPIVVALRDEIRVLNETLKIKDSIIEEKDKQLEAWEEWKKRHSTHIK